VLENLDQLVLIHVPKPHAPDRSILAPGHNPALIAAEQSTFYLSVMLEDPDRIAPTTETPLTEVGVPQVMELHGAFRC
jgi:hypothetical protein